ncbi:MAG: hypothetical protein ACR2QR_13190, partial [Woeseiaceae bacterium]
MSVSENSLVGLVLAIVCASSMIACTSQPETSEVLTFPARFADEEPLEPLVALAAFLDDRHFYIRYRKGEEILFTGSEWANRIELQEVMAGGPAPGPYILPLEYHQQQRWTDPPVAPVSARILSSADWQQFRDYFFDSILPKTGD